MFMDLNKDRQMETTTTVMCLWWTVLGECRWPAPHWIYQLEWVVVTGLCSPWAWSPQDDDRHGSTCITYRKYIESLESDALNTLYLRLFPCCVSPVTLPSWHRPHRPWHGSTVDIWPLTQGDTRSKGKKMAGRRRLGGTLHKTHQVSIVHMPCKLLKVFDVTGCRGEEDALLLLPGQVL